VFVLRELQTHIIRRAIKIDGELYELRHPDEMSLTEQHYLLSRSQQIEATFRGEYDPESLAMAERSLRECVALLMPTLPAAVADSLTDMQRMAILQGFTSQALPLERVSGLSGGNSFPGSNASTVADPATGS
jgi:hypothetical protein